MAPVGSTRSGGKISRPRRSLAAGGARERDRRCGSGPRPRSKLPRPTRRSTARRARPAPRWRPPRKRREGSRISAVAWPAGPLVGSAPPAIAGLPARRLDGGVAPPRGEEPAPSGTSPERGGGRLRAAGDSGFSRAGGSADARERERDGPARPGRGGGSPYLARLSEPGGPPCGRERLPLRTESKDTTITSTSGRARLPAGFKHITKRRKRN